MDQIEAIGFDMDYTLAQYNTAFDLLAYEGAKQKLGKKTTSFIVGSLLFRTSMEYFFQFLF